jgi:hypothetical protein
MGDFEEIALKFFVKGHTKNAVDRGFGHVRKKFARQDVWTMQQLVEVVEDSAASSATVHATSGSRIFKSFKPVLTEACMDIRGIRKYQLFAMYDAHPGTVFCRVGPDDEPVAVDLRRVIDGIKTDDVKVRVLFQTHLDAMPTPTPNSEKIATIHAKVRPYVPAEFQEVDLYAAPTEVQIEEATATKKQRSDRQRKKTAGSKAKSGSDAAEAIAKEAGDERMECSGVVDSSEAQADGRTKSGRRKMARNEV